MCEHPPGYVRLVVTAPQTVQWCRICGALRLSEQEWLIHDNHEFARRVLGRWGTVQALITACQAQLRAAADKGAALADEFDEMIRSIGGQP